MVAWSDLEVDLTIASYFDMLSKELAGKPYNKSAYRRALLPLLSERSKGSIEFKFQNISAVLITLGQPYIKGYVPLYNYQKILEDRVIDHLVGNGKFEQEVRSFIDKEPILNPKSDFGNFVVPAPQNSFAAEPEIAYARNLVKINFLEKEQEKRSLGMMGEQMIISYEKWNLNNLGKHKLAEHVRWIAQEDGDGAGFDILSKYPDGKDKYIEVKTTRLGKETPIYFSQNELIFSKKNKEDYHLYRLFDFDANARVFIKNGGLDTVCSAIPIQYKGYF